MSAVETCCLGVSPGFHLRPLASSSRSKHIKQTPTLTLTPRTKKNQTVARSRRVFEKEPTQRPHSKARNETDNLRLQRKLVTGKSIIFIDSTSGESVTKEKRISFLMCQLHEKHPNGRTGSAHSEHNRVGRSLFEQVSEQLSEPFVRSSASAGSEIEC